MQINEFLQHAILIVEEDLATLSDVAPSRLALSCIHTIKVDVKQVDVLLFFRSDIQTK